MHQLTGNTPFGWITVRSNGTAITGIEFSLDGVADHNQADDVSRETWREIEAYCDGELTRFNRPMQPKISPSLARWLGVLSDVPYGTTVTYKEFARLGGMPGAPRAAGSACARNPIPLIIPCHRVTRHDGSLGNFGAIRALSPKDPRNLAIKQKLIDHEHRYL